MGTLTWTPERIDEFRQRWETGEFFSAIARDMGTTKNALVGFANRNGWFRRVRFEPHQPTANPFGATPHTCKYGYGDPGDVGFHFCGADAAVGDVFCEDHKKLCYQQRPVELERITKLFDRMGARR